MNIQTKIVLGFLGLVVLGNYLAPFRQQAVNENKCIEAFKYQQRSNWDDRNRPDKPSAKEKRYFTALAYQSCNR